MALTLLDRQPFMGVVAFIICLLVKMSLLLVKEFLSRTVNRRFEPYGMDFIGMIAQYHTMETIDDKSFRVDFHQDEFDKSQSLCGKFVKTDYFPS